MIPTETSRNRCSPIIHAGAERGIRTMIARIMLAERYAVFSKRNAIASSDENNRDCEGDEVRAKEICLERSR